MIKNSKYKYSHIAIKKIKTYLTKPSTLVKNFTIYKLNKKLDKQFIKAFFENKEEFSKYRKEVFNSGLLDEIYKQRNFYLKTVNGKNVSGVKYNMGSVDIPVGLRLYCLVRKYKPETLVETGVCNGVSSAFLLLAIKNNQAGKLYSIDYPEVEGENHDKNMFWKGKGGAAIPKSKTSGWMIPNYLKDNWELILGKSQEKLVPLLKQLEKIDFFIHDSEHTYDCMMFEFEESYKVLSKNGFILSDNITSNTSFQDFCKKYGFLPFKISNATGIAIEPSKFILT